MKEGLQVTQGFLKLAGPLPRGTSQPSHTAGLQSSTEIGLEAARRSRLYKKKSEKQKIRKAPKILEKEVKYVFFEFFLGGRFSTSKFWKDNANPAGQYEYSMNAIFNAI